LKETFENFILVALEFIDIISGILILKFYALNKTSSSFFVTWLMKLS
jgi:purine-cytosine permease-like protein